MSRNSDEKSTKSSGMIIIGSHRFNIDKKELFAASGEMTPLRDQTSKILAALARRPNVIVSKDELIQTVWRGTFVTDDSLVQCIVEIRRALGQSARQVIETFPKKGYRLNVTPLISADDSPQIRPAIAVLPFVNLSRDPDQDFFADGMTEDVITGLSQFRSLFVIARNSSFSYKGQTPEVREVAQDLGVRYVLKGSVRQTGKRIRITGQLVDTAKGNLIWSQRYDRALSDIFAIQDEITEKIVATIAPEIEYRERRQAHRIPPDNLDVWGLYQRGLALHQSALGDTCKSVIEQFDKVCKLDPTFAPAFAMAASSRVRYALLFDPKNHDELLAQALAMARQGITLDARDSTCFWALGRVLTMLGNYDAAISSIEEAISLNPNDAMAHYYLAMALGSAGRLEDAVSKIDWALRLSPRDASGGGFRTYRSFVLFDLKRYDEALESAQHAIREPYPVSISFEIVTAALVKLQRRKEARVALKELLDHTPDISLSRLKDRPWIGRPESKQRFLDALSDAGLPKT